MVRTLWVLAGLAGMLAGALCGQTSCVFRFANIQQAQGLTEAATVIRSTGEIREFTVDAQTRTITLSGAPWQMDLTAWMVDKLDSASTNGHPLVEQYEIRGLTNPAVRIFYPARTQTIQSLQELTILIRSVLDIRQAFTVSARKAIVMRGTPDQLAAAEWLFQELDQNTVPHPASGIRELPDTEDNVLRVFYLSPSLPVEAFMRNTTAIRMEARIRRMFPYVPARAVALRGTADQVTTAERLIGERQLSAASGH